MNIFDLVTNTSSDVNITFDSIESTGVTFNKINIYNPDKILPLQKFWFFLENIRVIDINNNYIDFALSPVNINNNNFITFVNKLEDKINSWMLDIFDKHSFTKSIINSTNFFPKLKIKLTPSCSIYDNDNNHINSVNKNDIVNIYIELSNIWINNETNKIWCSYQILEMQKNNISFKIESFFKKDIKQPSIIPSPPPILPNLPNLPILPTHANKSIRMEISKDDLINQINKLKKIIPENNQKEEIKNTFNKVVSQIIKNIKLTNKELENEIKNVDNMANQAIFSIRK